MISTIIDVERLLTAETIVIPYYRNIKSRRSDKYELASERRLVIPGYQREIRWNTNNIQVLVDDLLNEEKFLGIILLNSEDDDTYNIIDGQQRITVLMMLITALGIRKKTKILNPCKFDNESIPGFMDALSHDFYSDDSKKKNLFKKKDRLHQYEKFINLWNYTKSVIDSIDESKLNEFEDNLLGSYLNIIVQRTEDKKKDKRICVDYFIDINNKNVRLDYIDILKAYAFKDNFDVIISKWISIQDKCNANSKKVYYPMESMLLHYVLCTVNGRLGNGVKSLTDDFKLGKQAKIHDITYEAGTNIEEIIPTGDYYAGMMDTLCSFNEFIKIVLAEKASYGEKFEGYFSAIDGVLNDEFKNNAFSIINGILRSSDIVPKLLLMKYYIFVICNKEATISDYKLIYPIGLLSTFFSSGKGDLKNRKEFSALVLSPNWVSSLNKKAYAKINKSPANLVFNKEIKYCGVYTESSGQYLARRLHSLLYSVSVDKEINYHPDAFRSFCASVDYNDEHFLINQSYVIDYQIGKKPCKYYYEEKIKSVDSHLSNYLIMLRKVNEKLGNKNIKDKIYIIDKYLSQGKKVFQDKLSEIKYEAMKEAFLLGECPSQNEIKKCKTEEEANELYKLYFTEHFTEEYQKYNSILIDKLSELEKNGLKYKKDI